MENIFCPCTEMLSSITREQKEIEFFLRTTSRARKVCHSEKSFLQIDLRPFSNIYGICSNLFVSLKD